MAAALLGLVPLGAGLAARRGVAPAAGTIAALALLALGGWGVRDALGYRIGRRS